MDFLMKKKVPDFSFVRYNYIICIPLKATSAIKNTFSLKCYINILISLQSENVIITSEISLK